MMARSELRQYQTASKRATEMAAVPTGSPETLTRSCPNQRGLADPDVDFRGLPGSPNYSEGLKT